MNRYFFAALFIGFGALLAHTGASGAQENSVTAIDIALEPVPGDTSSRNL
jgi:hypothetical protein